jgi:hypothetical protein
MKKNVQLALVITSMALVFTACKKNDDTAEPSITPNTGSFEFIKVGNKTIYDCNMKLGTTDTIIKKYLTDSVTKDMGNGAFKYHEVNSFEGINSDDFRYKTSTEFGLSDSLNQIKKTSMTIDAKVGDKYAHYDSSYVEITALNLLVTVPAGTFSCTKALLSQKGSPLTQNVYINFKNGLIKKEFYTQNTLQKTLNLASKNF